MTARYLAAAIHAASLTVAQARQCGRGDVRSHFSASEFIGGTEGSGSLQL
jgi:hypothetical protein